MNKRQTVYGLVNEWLNSIEGRITRSTYVKYEQLARNYILPFFESVSCEELDNNCLDSFYQFINRNENTEKKVLSAGNRRTIFMIVNNALDQAYMEQYLNRRYHIKPGISRPQRVVRVFSVEHQRKIEAYVLNHKDSFSLGIMIALFTGLRIGEICALQWRDIYFETGALYVNKTVQRLKSENTGSAKTKLLISPPKSAASNRLIPLPSFLIDYMGHFRQESEDSYVLANGKCYPMEPRTLQYHYRRILKEINVPYLNFHCLRHTFATRCVTLGWDMKTLSEVLGHFDIKITMEYYFHSTFEYKQLQMNKLSLLSQN